MADVVKFNSYEMAEKLREDVKKLVVAAIPQEAIDGMIKETYDTYFKNDNYNRESQFKNDVKNVIYQESRNLIHEHVRTALSNPELLTDLTKKVIEEAIPNLTKSLVTGMAQDLLQKMGKPY